jgi:hypothetical protein
VVDKCIPVVFVEVQDHLGVTARSKLVAASLQFPPKGEIVVDLAVVANDKRSLADPRISAPALEHHRLRSLIAQTDDGQPSVTESNSLVRGKP